MTGAYIGLGSNVGDRESNLNMAIGLISQSTPVLVTSSFYQTEPEGYKDQPDFLNSVAFVDAEGAAGELLKLLSNIEVRIGRERPFAGGPRVIDLDLLFFGGAIISEPGLEVPHPRLHLRAFVLVPMLEIAPGFIHPVLHKSMKELLAGLASGYRVEKWPHNTVKGSN
jgi:2-amino-4-hydroxy-6-hydroxymethyldihydropteridine diphosphokinase